MLFSTGHTFAKNSFGMMLSLIAGFVLGFVSSLQLLGPVALLVFRTAIKRDYKRAIIIALGATIPETIYCFLAVYGLEYVFEQYPYMENASKTLGVIIMVSLGTLFFFSKPLKEEDIENETRVETKTSKNVGGFFLGFSISSLNPVLIASWSAVIAMIISNFGRFTPWQLVLFPLFVSAGLLCASITVVLLIRKYRHKVKPNMMNRVVQGFGLAMIGLGLWLSIGVIKSLV